MARQAQRGLQAVILAGGEGKRLRPLTSRLPKPMIPLVNRPFLLHMIEYLAHHGVTDILLAMGYLPGPIRNHFGDGTGLGVNLTYSVEEKPLGTAGAVKLLERYLTGTCIVFNGDIVTDLDLSEHLRLHRERRAQASLFLVRVDDPSRFGVVETDASGRVLHFTEKPNREEARANTINGGCYILEPSVLAHVPPGEYHMFEHGLFPKLLQIGAPMYAYAPPAYWNDVGTPASYLQVHRDFLNGVAGMTGAERLPPSGVRLGQGCRVDATACITGPVVLGDGCRIGPSVEIAGPAVLGDGCRVDAGASISDSVLWDGVAIGESAEISGSAIASHAVIGHDVRLHGATSGERAHIGAGNRLPDGTVIQAGHVIQPREVVQPREMAQQ
ncbi:MAG: NDP-sugar synthase [Dehalococcoidia bacterium]|nr:NDP-sugar synthase [Dehalococcoidia bacterium]